MGFYIWSDFPFSVTVGRSPPLYKQWGALCRRTFCAVRHVWIHSGSCVDCCWVGCIFISYTLRFRLSEVDRPAPRIWAGMEKLIKLLWTRDLTYALTCCTDPCVVHLRPRGTLVKQWWCKSQPAHARPAALIYLDVVFSQRRVLDWTLTIGN